MLYLFTKTTLVYKCTQSHKLYASWLWIVYMFRLFHNARSILTQYCCRERAKSAWSFLTGAISLISVDVEKFRGLYSRPMCPSPICDTWFLYILYMQAFLPFYTMCKIEVVYQMHCCLCFFFCTAVPKGFSKWLFDTKVKLFFFCPPASIFWDMSCF